MIDRHTFIGHFVAAYLARVASKDPDYYTTAPAGLDWHTRNAHDTAERAWTAYADERGRRSQLLELSVDTPGATPQASQPADSLGTPFITPPEATQ